MPPPLTSPNRTTYTTASRLPSRHRRIPAGTGHRADSRQFRPRSSDRGRCGLRNRHPRRRIPRPLALQGVSHHRHRRHHRRSRCSGQSPRPVARIKCSTLSALPARKPPGLWEFLRDAADSKQLHTAKAAVGRSYSQLILPNTVSPARGTSSKARKAWPRHVHRRRSRQS